MSCSAIFTCLYRNGIRVVASANSTLRKSSLSSFTSHMPVKSLAQVIRKG